LYFGAYDKTSKNNLLSSIMNDNRLNHKCDVCGGIMEDECSKIITDFFDGKRHKG
jgi:tRNA(adenine34) deaminase